MIKISRRVLTVFLTLLVVSHISGCRSGAPSLKSASQLDEAFQPATALFENGRFEEAIRLYEKEIKAAQLRGVSDYILAQYRLKVADCYFSSKNYEKALEKVNLAIEGSGLEGDIKISPYLTLKSRILYKMKRFKEAQHAAESLLAIQESKLGLESSELIETLSLIIAPACAEDQCADTEPLITRQLKIREKHLGKEHEHVAASLAMLAELKEKRGDLDGAEKMYRKALIIRQKTAPHLVKSTEKNILRIELKRLKKQQ